MKYQEDAGASSLGSDALLREWTDGSGATHRHYLCDPPAKRADPARSADYVIVSATVRAWMTVDGMMSAAFTCAYPSDRWGRTLPVRALVRLEGRHTFDDALAALPRVQR